MNSETTNDISNKQLLWQLTHGQRKLIVGACLALLAANLCLFVPPILAKLAIDTLNAGTLDAIPNAFTKSLKLMGVQDYQDPAALLLLLAVLSILITAIAGGFQFARGRLTARASEAIAEDLRGRLYAHLHLARAQFFDQIQTGDLVQRCSSDVDTVRTFLASNLIDISRSIVMLICVIPILFWIDFTLACVSLILVPLISLGSYVFFSRIKTLFGESEEAEGRMTACLQENLTGIRVVKAFNRQAFETEKFAQSIDEYRHCKNRVALTMSYFWALSDLLCFTQIGVVLIVGAIRVQSAQLSIGELFAFSAYITMVVWPLRHLGKVLVDSGMAIVALGRIGYILAQPPEAEGSQPVFMHDSSTQVDEHVTSKLFDIRFRGVSFKYPTSRSKSSDNAINNIDLDIKRGETIAIMGAPGSGKTTLISLLLKLYEYQNGSIEIRGQLVHDVDRHWLREQIAVVFQEPFLYSRSIAMNLRMARGSASDAELKSVCVDSALHSTIADFSDGYNTLIGERGVTLSGGQRQRLALARALLKDAPILILDDSLSAVDSQTEKHIVKALRARAGRHTTLIVAHRLSSVRHADRIVVMHNGRISQLGTHAELLSQPGFYQQLCRIQGEAKTSEQQQPMLTG